MAVDLAALADAIVNADMEAGISLTRQGLDSGMNAKEIVNDGLIGGMDIIADLWVKEEIFIPEVLLSAKVMHACMDILRPILEQSNEPPRGVIVIGTVKGDLHDIGQNIVTMMLRGNGFEVHNIGPNSSPEKFAEQAKSVNADLIGLSALLTTTMPMQAQTTIMVGGAPVTADWAEKIGSDGYAPDAARAVTLAKQLMEDLREELEA
jgi:5-methyltetrahydrofolate--homocysteine methyltransferase